MYTVQLISIYIKLLKKYKKILTKRFTSDRNISNFFMSKVFIRIITRRRSYKEVVLTFKDSSICRSFLFPAIKVENLLKHWVKYVFSEIYLYYVNEISIQKLHSAQRKFKNKATIWKSNMWILLDKVWILGSIFKIILFE